MSRFFHERPTFFQKLSRLITILYKWESCHTLFQWWALSFFLFLVQSLSCFVLSFDVLYLWSLYFKCFYLSSKVCYVLCYPSMSYICDPASVSISEISPKPHFVGCLNIETLPSSTIIVHHHRPTSSSTIIVHCHRPPSSSVPSSSSSTRPDTNSNTFNTSLIWQDQKLPSNHRKTKLNIQVNMLMNAALKDKNLLMMIVLVLFVNNPDHPEIVLQAGKESGVL